MFRKTSDEVIVCIRYEDGTSSVKTAKTHDGKWDISSIWMAEVTHWMPLPSIEGIRGNQRKTSQLVTIIHQLKGRKQTVTGCHELHGGYILVTYMGN